VKKQPVSAIDHPVHKLVVIFANVAATRYQLNPGKGRYRKEKVDQKESKDHFLPERPVGVGCWDVIHVVGVE
jgi:hypothetical protein